MQSHELRLEALFQVLGCPSASKRTALELVRATILVQSDFWRAWIHLHARRPLIQATATLTVGVGYRTKRRSPCGLVTMIRSMIFCTITGRL